LAPLKLTNIKFEFAHLYLPLQIIKNFFSYKYIIIIAGEAVLLAWFIAPYKVSLINKIILTVVAVFMRYFVTLRNVKSTDVIEI